MSHQLNTTRPSLIAAWEALKPRPISAPAPDVPDINGDELLSEVLDFIGRYLHCSEHQRTVLALWIFHTHCSFAATTTPYLAIRSDHKQSGKTLCLHLLSLLSSESAFSSGFTAATLSRRIDPVPRTMLLDEFQATIGTRSRSKNPLLRALLVSGSRSGPGYTDRTHERNLFCPKAFAGIGQLPEMLADRSIPIILEPLTRNDRIERFNHHHAFDHAKQIRELLHFWTLDYEPIFEEMPSLTAEQF